MFKAYEELTKSKAVSAAQKKRDLANEICMELTVHAQIDEAADVDDKFDAKVIVPSKWGYLPNPPYRAVQRGF